MSSNDGIAGGSAPRVFLRLRDGACLCLLGWSLAGCQHKPPPFQIPRALAPVALEDVPLADSGEEEIAELPTPELAPLEGPPLPRPAPHRHIVAPKEEPPPQTAAPNAAPIDSAALAIGDLSTGGDQATQSQQQARELLDSIQRRLAALSAERRSGQRRQLQQVQHFLDQAARALASGDGDGALNLANKARLLMDDLEKR